MNITPLHCKWVTLASGNLNFLLTQLIIWNKIRRSIGDPLTYILEYGLSIGLRSIKIRTKILCLMTLSHILYPSGWVSHILFYAN